MAWDGHDRRRGGADGERLGRLEEWRDGHETKCTERYEQLFASIKELHGRINTMIGAVGGFTIVMLIGAVGYFLSQKLA